MIIAFDCDVTFVRTDLEWLKWLENVTQHYDHGLWINGYKTDIRRKTDYNLSNYFSKQLYSLGMSGYEYWEEIAVYDDLEPIEGAVKCLYDLYRANNHIVCVSKAMGNHHHSKENFIKKYCPFVDDIILCNNKSHILCDIIIEDRVQNLYGFIDTLGIIIDNPYIIHENDTDHSYTVVQNWNQITDRVQWADKHYF